MKELHELNDAEIRVLGSMMEKSKTTPDYYPMTLNSLTAACNQKSARNPVVDYDEETVMKAIRSLKGQSLVSLSVGGTNRSEKFKHNFDIVYTLTEAQYATLCLLFLRGPMTAGEINSNSSRLHEFSSLGAVQETLHSLADAEVPMVKELPRRAGQKETRYVHLFGGTIAEETAGELTTHTSTAKKSASELEERLQKVEGELHELKEKFEKVMRELGL